MLPHAVIRDSEDTRLTHISKRIELNGLAFQRGPVIDHQHMKAANHRGGGAVELKRGARRLALSFEDNDGECDPLLLSFFFLLLLFRFLIGFGVCC